MSKALPCVSVVVIGLNTARTIVSCLESIKKSDYPRLEIIYVDGGSKDDSIKLANHVGGVKIMHLDQSSPTPGRQRNEGWKAAGGELIQFADSDMIMHPDWIRTAVQKIDAKHKVLCGYRIEMYARKNGYHLISDIDWDRTVGDINNFTGEVLISRHILEQSGGYDESLIVGENREFSYRLKDFGITLRRLGTIMSYHDINMDSFRKYWRRSYRTGYGLTEVSFMRLGKKDYGLKMNVIKSCIKGIGTPLCIISALVIQSIPLFILALLLNMMVIPQMLAVRNKGFKVNEVLLYAIHTLMQTYPFTLGVFRYLVGRIISKPMRNKVNK